jgi:hypothetical protein
MGLWHDLRALDAVEEKLRELRAAAYGDSADYGAPVTYGDASDNVHTSHAITLAHCTVCDEIGVFGAAHEGCSRNYTMGTMPITVTGSFVCVDDDACSRCGLAAHGPCPEAAYDPFMADETPLVEYAGEDVVAEALVDEFFSDAASCVREWYDIGTCAGCGAYGKAGLMHYRYLSHEGGVSECGQYL